MMHRLVHPVGLVAILALSACGEEAVTEPEASRTCDPGATQACVCTGGESGAQSCEDDGLGWASCLCTGGNGGGGDNECPQADHFLDVASAPGPDEGGLMPRLTVECTETEALMEFSLAPLAARRDIAMLGVIHRTVLGKGPEHFQQFFRPEEATKKTRWTRQAARRHAKQLEDPRKGAFPELLRRSALGLVAVYNLLPKEVVTANTVKDFQKQLQGLLKQRATAGCEDWAETLSPRIPLWKHPLR